MMGFTQRMLLVCALVLLAGPIQVVLAEANAVEIDVYETAICEQEIVLPDGSTEIVLMTGQATVHVFFEGPVEGAAYDDDGDGLDEVQTEMVELDLRGYSPTLGPVRMRLNTAFRSTGIMEETINNRSGVLDVPPFAKTGSVESFFDVFFEVEIAGQVFFGEGPMRWRGLLREKPAGPLDLYENQADIQLLNAVGVPSGFLWGANRFRPNPVVEVDYMDTSMGSVDLITPLGQSYAIELEGNSTMHVFFEGAVEGSANDDDGDTLDEVRTELVQLDLSGSGSELGAVRMRLNTNYWSTGIMEETINNRSGVLDVPPFAQNGTVESFFNVFFKVEMLGQVFYGRDPMHLRGTLTEKPAGPLDIYENLVDIQLMDENGNPTGFFLGAVRYKPRACGDAEHPYPIGDLNKDCEVNFFDIAILSLHWLDCTRPECN